MWLWVGPELRELGWEKLPPWGAGGASCPVQYEDEGSWLGWRDPQRASYRKDPAPEFMFKLALLEQRGLCRQAWL